MPSVSAPQQRAMFAAAEGKSTLGIPQSVGQDFVTADHVTHNTGLPPGKKKTHRGGGRGKGNGQPGASHHTAMNKAYASGDFQGAKKHALNFANALHGHVSGKAPSPTGSASMSTPAPPDVSRDASAPQTDSAPSNDQAMLIRALMNRSQQ